METDLSTGTTSGMTIRVVDSYDELSQLAADRVSSLLAETPDAALTLPTGSTPSGMYRELVRRVEAGELDFTHAQFFCLDDYLGATVDDDASLTRWLRDIFLVPAKLSPQNIHMVPSTAADPNAAGAAYDAEIAALGGLQLAILGLGPNGHIGFNEPGSLPDDPTRVVDLQAETRAQSAAYWDGRADIPAQALTTGLKTILAARKLVLIVSGESKAEIVRASLQGPETADVPGSWLRRAGERLEVILDREAASLLDL